MTHLVLGSTERGFELVKFQDVNDQACSLQQSSAMDDTQRGWEQAGSSNVWFGVDHVRMHLSREHVELLLPCLQRWLEKGSLYDPEQASQQQMEEFVQKNVSAPDSSNLYIIVEGDNIGWTRLQADAEYYYRLRVKILKLRSKEQKKAPLEIWRRTPTRIWARIADSMREEG